MNTSAAILREQKLPVVHKMIDDLPTEDLQLVEIVLARLEMDRLWKDVRSGFDVDWSSGNFSRLDEVIREVRDSLKSNVA